MEEVTKEVKEEESKSNGTDPNVIQKLEKNRRKLNWKGKHISKILIMCVVIIPKTILDNSL